MSLHLPTIEKYINNNYWTNYVGLSRTVLALGTLLTLLFNSSDTLFTFGLQNEISYNCNNLNIISLYCLTGNVMLTKAISIIVLLLVIIGIRPQWTCIPHWWVTYSFTVTSYAIDGGDQVTSILTFLLIPICLTDNRISHWKRNEADPSTVSFYRKTIAFFAFTMIQIQVAFIYFNAAVGKFTVPEWLNGTAVYYWSTNQLFGLNDNIQFLFMYLLKNPFGITFVTWGVLVFELFLFSCIFIKNKKVKEFAWIAGIVFHFAIIVFHGLISFFFAMFSALTLFLVAKNRNL